MKDYFFTQGRTRSSAISKGKYDPSFR